jgi:hypothetical protein
MKRRIRVFVVGLAAVGAVAGTAGPASAEQPTRFFSKQFEQCGGVLVAQFGTVEDGIRLTPAVINRFLNPQRDVCGKLVGVDTGRA